MLKIINWNLERLSKISSIEASDMLAGMDADIIVLTETATSIDLGKEYHTWHSTPLKGLHDGIHYKDGEARTSIMSKFPVVNTISTFDGDTNCTAVLNTPFGELTVYAAVIGIFGNRHANFKTGLKGLLSDIRSLPQDTRTLIAGDFNLSFSDNYYFTRDGRDQILQLMEERALSNVTAHIPQNIDHILISADLVSTANTAVKIFNVDKKYSDHIIIVSEIY